MIRRENPNFLASLYAPNPKEVTYWIDLTASPDGLIIKTYVNNRWVKINEDDNTELSADIALLREDVNSLASTKADKSTTLSGYGITNAYTKTEVDNKVNAKANSSDVYTKTLTNDLIDAKVSSLVDQAPETLDTLNELAAALGNDPNFATTVSNLIGTKLSTSTYNTDKATFATKTELNTKVSGTGITGIQVVTELPGSLSNNVLYIVKKS